MNNTNKATTGYLQLILPQSLHHVEKIRTSVMDFFHKNNIDEEIIAQIEISVYEVLINILDHTPLRHKNQKIEIRSHIFADRVETIIENAGDFFDISSVSIPDIDRFCSEGRRRGLGIYMIKTLMDNVAYAYHNSTNIITLTKFRRSG